VTLVPVDNAVVPAGSPEDDRRPGVITLYTLGLSTPRIAKVARLTPARVNEIIREEIERSVKRVGTEGVRMDNLTNLEMIKRRLLNGILATDEDEMPDKGDVRSLTQVMRLQQTLAGGSSPDPIAIAVPEADRKAQDGWLGRLVAHMRIQSMLDAGTITIDADGRIRYVKHVCEKCGAEDDTPGDEDWNDVRGPGSDEKPPISTWESATVGV
jgi:hypothetical protein